MKGTLPDHW